MECDAQLEQDGGDCRRRADTSAQSGGYAGGDPPTCSQARCAAEDADCRTGDSCPVRRVIPLQRV